MMMMMMATTITIPVRHATLSTVEGHGPAWQRVRNTRDNDTLRILKISPDRGQRCDGEHQPSSRRRGSGCHCRSSGRTGRSPVGGGGDGSGGIPFRAHGELREVNGCHRGNAGPIDFHISRYTAGDDVESDGTNVVSQILRQSRTIAGWGRWDSRGERVWMWYD